MYSKKKQEEKQKNTTKDSRKVIKPPPPTNTKGVHQRMNTGDSQKHKQDQQIQKLTFIVRQFLQKMGFTRTAAVLNNQKLTRKPTKQQQSTQQNLQSLLIHFQKGNREQFFRSWVKWFHNVQDIAFKKLQFQLHIYFYIYSIHPEYRKNINATIDQASVQFFKKYLETKGSDLSRTTEFLSFYALPYIQKPQQHPAISHVFTKQWLLRLKKGLQQFIKNNNKMINKNQKNTILQNIYRNSLNPQNIQVQKVECNHQTEIEQLKQQNQSLVAHVQNMQQNFKMVSEVSKSNMLQSQAKWFQFSKEILKLVKKIQKGQKMDSKIQQLDDFFSRDMEQLFITKDISIFERNSVTTQDNFSISPLSPLSPARKNQPQIQKVDHILPIDSAKILAYLKQCERPQNQIGAFLVLQALRWRFTKLKNSALRRQVILNYSLNDLCMVTKPNWKIQESILFRSPTRVKVCYLRLLNYITSDYVGINYLNKEPKLISNLIKVFKQQNEDNSTKKHSLGVLQKLSLLRQPQQIMLKEGILVEIIKLLNTDSLSDYTVQYLTALLMNLSLRKLGKPHLQEHKNQLVEIIYNYLFTDNVQVKNYINGTLYSFLQMSEAFRQASLKKGMVERIDDLIKNCEQKLFAHQYELIIQKLKSSKSSQSQDNQSDQQDQELDYDDVDDEEQNDLIDDDKSSQCYEWQQQYLNGEQLLMKQFPLLGPEGMKDQMLTKSMIEDNTKKNNLSSISRSKRGNEVFGGRPVTPSLSGIDNELEKSLIRYSKM